MAREGRVGLLLRSFAYFRLRPLPASEGGTARQVAEEDFAGFFVLFADESQTEQKAAHSIFGIVGRMHFCGDPLCVPCHFTECADETVECADFLRGGIAP